MSKNKRLLRTLFFCACIFITSVCSLSCDLFYESVNYYLERYTSEIVPGAIVPMEDEDYYSINNNTINISSEKDFTFRIFITNPNDVQTFIYRAQKPADASDSHETDFETNALIDNGSIVFDYNYDQDPNVLFVTFKKEYLKTKDVDGQRDFITYIKFVKREHNIPDNPDAYTDYPLNTPFPFQFTVNTRPLILENSPVCGKMNFTDGSTKNVVCFNIKPPASNTEIYSDLQNPDGSYSLKINGQSYSFTFSGNTPVFSDTSKFYNSKESVPLYDSFTLTEGNFLEKSNSIYFIDDTNAEKDYTIFVQDFHGLEKTYPTSTRPSGKQKINCPSPSINSDVVTISPDFKTTPQKPGENPKNLSSVILNYSINGGEYKTEELNKTTNPSYKIYVPGGSTRIDYYLSSQSNEILSSDIKTAETTLSNTLYVKPSQENEAYGGGAQGHEISLKNAISYLADKSGEWTINLGSSTYEADSSEDISEANDYTYIFLKKAAGNNSDLTINLSGTSNTSRATFNAKQLGRVLYTINIKVNLTNVNITGGKTKTISPEGGGIRANTKLTLTNCDIYSNEGSYGAGIYKPYTDLVLTNCKIYDNKASASGGGIYIENGKIGEDNYEPKLTLTDCTVGDIDSPNIATNGNGGGIFIRTKGDITFSNTVIGSTSETNSTTKWANTAKTNGGGIYFSGPDININSASLNVSFTNGTKIYKNKADQCGGGIYSGGGYKLYGTSTLSNFDVEYNKSTNGGGISLDSYTEVKYSTVSNNQSSYGGGVYIEKASAQLIDANDISYNSATYGGGVACSPKVNLSSGKTSFDSNYKVENGPNIHHNSAKLGGGIYITDDSSISGYNIYNNTNGDASSAEGSGIYTATGKKLTLMYIHMANNSDSKNNAKGDVYCDELFNISYTNYFAEEVICCSKEKLNMNNNFHFADDTSKLKIYILNGEEDDILYKNAIDKTWCKDWMYRVVSANDGYTLTFARSNKMELIESRRVVSSTRSLQDVINWTNLMYNCNQTYPGEIFINEDFTEEAAEKKSDTIYSPAIFSHSNASNASQKYYIVYGNYKTYNANRSASYPGSAIYIEQYNNVTIKNLTIKGGYAKIGCNNGRGGGVYIKGTLTTEKTNIGYAPGDYANYTTNSYPTTSTKANYANNCGGGVFIDYSGIFNMQDGTNICGNQANPSNNVETGYGGGVYISSGGRFKMTDSSERQISYNYSKLDGSAIFCEANGYLTLSGNIYIKNNASNKGSPGIHLKEDAYFSTNYVSSSYKITITNNKWYNKPAERTAVGIHCPGQFLKTENDETKPLWWAYMNMSNENDQVDLMLVTLHADENVSNRWMKAYYFVDPTGGNDQYLTSTFTIGRIMGTGANEQKKCAVPSNKKYTYINPQYGTNFSNWDW